MTGTIAPFNLVGADLNQLAKENGLHQSHQQLTLKTARTLDGHPIKRHVRRFGGYYGLITTLCMALLIGGAAAFSIRMMLRKRSVRLLELQRLEDQRKNQQLEAFLIRHRELTK